MSVAAAARGVGHSVAPWIEKMARLGYVAKGVVYLIVGILTVASGLGARRGEADQHSAFSYILAKPFGVVLLLVIALGLVGYAIWRVISGITDTERRGSDAKGLALRAGSIIRGLAYGGIALEVLGLALHHRGGSGSDSSARHWTGRLMAEPFGRWLVGLAGLVIIGYGFYQLHAAWSSKLSKKLHLGSVAPSTRRLLIELSRVGIASRGVVFAIIGGSVVRAAVHYNPAAARGTAGALRFIGAQPFGALLLVLIGIGIAAYGIYAFINARYREVDAG